MSFIERLKRIFGGNGASGEGTPDSGMISCEEALSLVYEFLDGELEETPRQKVQEHFDVCQRCYPHLRLEESFRAALQRATHGEVAPPELKSRLLDLIAETTEG